MPSWDPNGEYNFVPSVTRQVAATPQGTELLAESTFTRANGTKGAILEAIFEMNDIDTIYRGEKAIAPWVKATGLSAKGFGEVADLGVVMSNDPAIAAEAIKVAAAMSVPNLKTMVGQVGGLLSMWGQSLDLTRELTPVLTRVVNGQTQLIDRGVYVEDARGGYWTLASGRAKPPTGRRPGRGVRMARAGRTSRPVSLAA